MEYYTTFVIKIEISSKCLSQYHFLFKTLLNKIILLLTPYTHKILHYVIFNLPLVSPFIVGGRCSLHNVTEDFGGSSDCRLVDEPFELAGMRRAPKAMKCSE